LLEARSHLTRTWQWDEVPTPWQFDALAEWLGLPARPRNKAGEAAWKEQLRDEMIRLALVCDLFVYNFYSAAHPATAAAVGVLISNCSSEGSQIKFLGWGRCAYALTPNMSYALLQLCVWL
jgi:hypothetical protein